MQSKAVLLISWVSVLQLLYLSFWQKQVVFSFNIGKKVDDIDIW